MLPGEREGVGGGGGGVCVHQGHYEALISMQPRSHTLGLDSCSDNPCCLSISTFDEKFHHHFHYSRTIAKFELLVQHAGLARHRQVPSTPSMGSDCCLLNLRT